MKICTRDKPEKRDRSLIHNRRHSGNQVFGKCLTVETAISLLETAARIMAEALIAVHGRPVLKQEAGHTVPV